MKCNKKLLIILIVAALFRILHCLDLPLTGEELGVAMLQACGHAYDYKDKLPQGIVPADRIKSFIRYCPDHSSKDVVDSMRFAGMHPPVYYLTLHNLLKFTPYSDYLVRSISFVASMLSIIFIYLIGKQLYCQKTGLIAAAILACSGYGIHFGTLGRPYSMIMAISLITTYLAWKLNEQNRLSFRNPKIYIYILLSVMGIYTLFHFVFVIAFQMIFMLIASIRDKKSVLTIIAAGIIILAAFLPLIGFLRDQMQVITNGEYYFHQKPDIVRFIGDLSSINSVRFFRLDSETAKAVVAMTFAAVTSIACIAGIATLTGNRNRRLFFTAFLAHLVIYFVFEKILNVNSMHRIKMLFFILPIFLIFLAESFRHLTKRFHLRIVIPVLFTTILLGNSVAATIVVPKLTGPYRYLELIPPKIQTYIGNDKKGLVVFTKKIQKPLFAFANILDDNMDTLIVPPPMTDEKLNSLMDFGSIEKYDALFVTEFYEPYHKKDILQAEKKMITDYLQRLGFSYSKTWDSKYEPQTRAVMLFEKNSK